MSKIMKIVKDMGHVRHIDRKTPITKSMISIQCSECKEYYTVQADAIYRQHKRGKNTYVCKKCASILGWTNDKKEKASRKSSKMWDNPCTAGEIIGKAVANEIIKETGLKNIIDDLKSHQ